MAWTRRHLLLTGLRSGLGIALGSAAPLVASPGAANGKRAIDLVDRSLVVDMLGLLTLDWARLRAWQRDPTTFDDAAFRKLRATGIDVFHPAVDTNYPDPRLAALVWTGRWNQLLSRQPCRLQRIDSVEDIERLRIGGRIGVVIGFQNSDHFESIDDVGLFFGRGQRVSQLTYNRRNALGGGCHDPSDRGLTPFGREVVGEMNRVGMAVDLSHCGERTTREAIEASETPVLITHSNCRSLVPHQRRAKSDATIRALAERGGVLGLTLVRAFVGRGHPTLADALDHFDRVVELAGVDAVGLGTDLSDDVLDPARGRQLTTYEIDGLEPPRRAYQIAEGLLDRGYSRDDVGKILGGNFLRVLRRIWPPGPPLPSDRHSRRDPFCTVPRGSS